MPDDFDFQRTISDEAARVAHYRPMVESYYEQVTDTYRENWGESFHFAVFHGQETLAEAMTALERSLADESGLKPGMRALDVGCGIGGPATTVAERSGAHVTGLNLSQKQIGLATARAAQLGLADRVRFDLGDAMRMAYPDASFDVVYLFESGCHMPDKARFFKECARVLKPGGVFLGYDWLAKDGLTDAEHAEYIEPICKYHSVPHLGTVATSRQNLVAAGLSVEECVDVAERGNITRNWEILDEKAIATINALPPGAIPPTLGMMIKGGVALKMAAARGYFAIGHWRARKQAG